MARGIIALDPDQWWIRPQSETDALVPTLAALNRLGFLTDCSQPALEVEGGEGQRACVWGFCSEDTAETIARACLPTELVCIAAAPGSAEGPWIPVTLADGLAYTWIHPPMPPSELFDQWGSRGLSPHGLTALADAWQVNVFDPRWGRNDLLWPELLAALEAPPRTGAFPPGAHEV